jgi:hypothetical protein
MVVLPWMFPPLAVEVHSGVHIKEKKSAHLHQAACAVATFKENHCVNTKVFICSVARELRLISNIQNL